MGWSWDAHFCISTTTNSRNRHREHKILWSVYEFFLTRFTQPPKMRETLENEAHWNPIFVDRRGRCGTHGSGPAPAPWRVRDAISVAGLRVRIPPVLRQLFQTTPPLSTTISTSTSYLLTRRRCQALLCVFNRSKENPTGLVTMEFEPFNADQFRFQLMNYTDVDLIKLGRSCSSGASGWLDP